MPEVSTQASGWSRSWRHSPSSPWYRSERSHHAPVSLEDPGAPRVLLRQRPQQLRRAGGHPAIAAAPVEGRVGRVEEEAVRLLELVQVGDHRQGGAIEVPGLAGRAVGLDLDRGDHVHVVDPVAGLGGDAVRGRGLPLLVREAAAQLEEGRLLRLEVDLERHRPEHAIVDVGVRGDVLRALGRQERVELAYQPVPQVGVADELRERQGAVPGTDLGVDDETRGPLERAHHEVQGDALPDLARRRPRRPVAKLLALGGRSRARSEHEGPDDEHRKRHPRVGHPQASWLSLAATGSGRRERDGFSTGHGCAAPPAVGSRLPPEARPEPAGG